MSNIFIDFCFLVELSNSVTFMLLSAQRYIGYRATEHKSDLLGQDLQRR